MRVNRRDFIGTSGWAALAGIGSGAVGCSSNKQGEGNSLALSMVKSMTNDVVPISVEERRARIKKAQRLMRDEKMEALVLDAGTAMQYFTGIRWGRSERPMVAIVPAKGEVKYVCPGFEESRLLEMIEIGKDVYAWQEHESPYAQIAVALKDSGISSGTIGVEEQVRFFILDGIQKAAPPLRFVSGDPVTVPCRIIKSKAELALMQKANDITIAAMTLGINSLKEAMSPSEFSEIVNDAHTKLGAEPSFAGVNFGEASAFPHGSIQPQKLKKGDVVLMDCGCRVSGYCSDISRTIVFGAAPTDRQMEIWNLEKKAQAAGFAAAKIGAALEEVDNAARKVLTDAGFGPEYKLPGLPHRTGHGIGMDVHEWGNAVKGNKTILEPGMCFSIEPNISIVGEFGVRHEDCVYMTEEGPQWFSQPAVSIGQPFVNMV
jgi:Xaa-Pro dipeptidase